ncbi:MAG: hypothetical protein JTJ26_03995 [Prevotella sp.]|nr:hypothetical protein [Prevotella sp.]
MKEENNNNVNEQQATTEVTQKAMATCNKIIAIADKITDDYNDDPDVYPYLEFLGIGIFLHRIKSSLEDKDATHKNGKPLSDQTPGPIEVPTFASMLDVIKEGYEIGQMTEYQIPKEPEQTPEDNGK